MATTNYVWDPLNESYLMETDQAGAATAVYTQEPLQYGGLISQKRGADTSYFQQDNLGSTRLLTDDSGSVTDRFAYDAWGNEVDRTGLTETPFRWVGNTGYYFEIETDSYYVRARTYQPNFGRWTNFDPLRLSAGLNMLAYTDNRPTFFIDSSGLDCECCCCVDDADITDIKRWIGLNRDELPLWGHSFTHISNLSYVRGPKGDCLMEWFECSTAPTEEMKKAGIGAGIWHDAGTLDSQKTSPTFEEWVKYKAHQEPYGSAIQQCRSVDVRAKDVPRGLRQYPRILRIAVRVSSALNCKCKNKNIVISFEQILKSNDESVIPGDRIGYQERDGEIWSANVYFGECPDSEHLKCGKLPE